jgi:hypothetical protein
MCLVAAEFQVDSLFEFESAHWNVWSFKTRQIEAECMADDGSTACGVSWLVCP